MKTRRKSIEEAWNFKELVSTIRLVHDELGAQASRAVNASLTLRNWLVGYYIKEYEQNGSDRARYGTCLMESLALELQKSVDCCYSSRYLRLCRQFYQTYPEMWKSMISKSAFKATRKSPISKLPPLSSVADYRAANSERLLSPEKSRLFERLSFTHIIELLKCDDSTMRAFYEAECIRGNWSVRELKRQIGSLYYERSGLSKNKKKLSALTQKGAEPRNPELAIRDPYIFEFLRLKPKEVMGESHLEDELLDRIQEFMLELGHGFCFEARQRRILIGDEYFFVDLVFYHRILKCHVLVELKLERFSQQNIGQLNTYVSWYRKNVMPEGDNPPIGILLCTGKNHALIEYALAGMDNQLFVSKYLLELPKKEQMQKFIEEQLRD
jgi:predicted nuclease of restriction endonuclease-like (RecB) superfamily